MPYWDNVVRSFEISWRHRYLWLLALFAGESGGASFSYSQGVRGGTGSPSQNAQQVATWINQHAGLLIGISLVWVIGVILLFVLAAVCEGGLIRGAAEHDAARPFRLGAAWRSGVGTMWLMVRVRLLLIALALPAAVVLLIFVGAFVAAIALNSVVAILVGLVGLLAVLAAILYFIYLSLLDRLGSRTAILEHQPAVASLVRAHRLVRERFGRVILVWLVSVAVGIVVGLASTFVLGVIALPAIISILVLVAGGPSWLWFVFALGVLIVLVVGIPLNAFLAAQASTYWTLSFRRLELEQAS